MEISAINQRFECEVTEASLTLKPEDCAVVADLAAPLHRTAVWMVPEAAATRLAELLAEMSALEPSLLCNAPNLLHLTIFHWSLAEDGAAYEEVIREWLRSGEQSVQLRGWLATSRAIGVAGYMQNDSWLTARRRLHAVAGKTVDEDYFGTFLTWVTLARYGKVPSPDVLAFVRDHSGEDFGTFSIEEVQVYESASKDLSQAKLVATISR